MKPKEWGLTEGKAKLVMLGRSIVRKFDSTLSSSSAACLKKVQEFLTTVPLVHKVHLISSGSAPRQPESRSLGENGHGINLWRMCFEWWGR
jgi:hypothetical protein